MLQRTPLFAESWNVAWRKLPTGSLLENRKDKFVIVKNSFRYWAADPFLFRNGGDTFIFTELYDYMKRRGCIGYCKWNGKTFSSWKAVITETYHLSYPYIFEWNGSIYIMPESGADHSLYLYRAVNFPDHWEKTQILRKNVVYGDTTPLQWHGHQYALAYDVNDPSNYKLQLLDLEESENDCEIYVVDPELRRPAGKPFRYHNMNLRPAQNCRNGYGNGLLFYQYQLRSNVYCEKCIEMIAAQDLCYSRKIILDGIHTYNANDEFEVIDIKTRRFNLLNLISRIIGKLRN